MVHLTADRLGGAGFRLPLLIGPLGFAALQAVIMNKVMSLILVLTALRVLEPRCNCGRDPGSTTVERMKLPLLLTAAGGTPRWTGSAICCQQRRYPAQ